MFQSRRHEGVPTRWHRLADSELFTALHENSDSHALLPTTGHTERSLRRYVAMQYGQLPASWLLDEDSKARRYPHQLTRPGASISSAEMTPMWPHVATRPCGVYQPPRQQPNDLLQRSVQPQQQQLRQPQQQPQPQQQSLPSQQPQGLQRQGNYAMSSMLPVNIGGQHSIGAGLIRAVHKASGSLPWQAPQPAAFGSPLLPAARQEGASSWYSTAAAEGPMATAGLIYPSATDASGYSAPVHEGLLPAAAVAAVSAVQLGDSSSGVARDLLTVALSSPAVTDSPSKAPQASQQTPRPMMSSYYTDQQWRQPGHAAGLHSSQKGLLRRELLIPPPLPPHRNGSPKAPVYRDPIPPDTNDITAIHQWLLLVPDHSKMALAKAWAMSLHHAPVAVAPASLVSKGTDAAATGNHYHWNNANKAVWDPAWRPAAATAASQQPCVVSPQLDFAMKASVYHPAGTTLTPELVLQYTNLLYGEDWDMQPLEQHHLHQPPRHLVNHGSSGILGGSTFARPTNTVIAALPSGTQRLYNMYNQLLGAAVSQKSNNRPPEIPERQPVPKPLACMPYTPDLAEHISKVSSGAPPSPHVMQYVPKAAVYQAAWAVQRAAARKGLLAADASMPVAAPTGWLTSSSNALYARGGASMPAVMAQDNNGCIDAVDYPSQTLQPRKQESAPRCWDRQRMESVLAPVFMVDFDNGQVAIAYVNAHGRSDVETQTDGGHKSRAAAAAADLDNASQSSAMGSGTDMSADDSSYAGTSDDSMTTSSPTSTVDEQQAARVAAKGGSKFHRLLQSMNIFSRWRHHRRQGARGSGGEGAPLQRDSTAFGEVSAARNMRMDDGASPDASGASTDRGVVMSSDNPHPAAASGTLVATTTSSTAVTSATVDTKRSKKRRKVKEPLDNSAHIDGLAVNGTASMDQHQMSSNTGSSPQPKIKRKKPFKDPMVQRKVEDMEGTGQKAAASNNNAASGNAQGISKKSKSSTKSHHQSSTKSAAADTVESVVSPAAVGTQGSSEASESKGFSKAPVSTAATEQMDAAIGTGPGMDDAGGTSTEFGDRSMASTDPAIVGPRPRVVGSSSKACRKGRHYFSFRFWKRAAAADGTQAAEASNEGLVDDLQSDDPVALGQELAEQEMALNGPVEVPRTASSSKPMKTSKAASRLLKFMRLKGVQGKGATRPRKKTDSSTTQAVNDDSTDGDNVGRAGREDRLVETAAAAASTEGDGGGGPITVSGSKAARSRVTSAGGKKWLQRFHIMTARSLLGKKVPNATTPPATGFIKPNGKAHSKQKHDKAAVKRQHHAQVSSLEPAAAAGSKVRHGAGDRVIAIDDDVTAGPDVNNLIPTRECSGEGEVEVLESSTLPMDQVTLATAKGQNATPHGSNGNEGLSAKLKSQEERKGNNGISGLFANILGRHNRNSSHSPAVKNEQQVPISETTATGAGMAEDESIAAAPDNNVQTTAAALLGTGCEHSSMDAGKQQGPSDKEEAATTDVLDQRTAAGDAGSTAGTEGPTSKATSIVSSSNLVKVPVLPESILQNLTPEAANNEIEAMAPDTQGEDANVEPSTLLKGNKSLKGNKAKGREGKRPSNSATPPDLPPPQGPKAKLMQKLLKLSDVVNAQRAAVTGSPPSHDITTTRAMDTAASEERQSSQVVAFTDTCSQPALVKEDESSDIEQLQQEQQQQQQEQQEQQEQLLAAGPEASIQQHNKPVGALERLKNTLGRTHKKQAGSDHKITKVSSKAAQHNVGGQDNAMIAGKSSQGDSNNASTRSSQDHIIMWGTQRRNKEDSLQSIADRSEIGAPKHGGKATVMERMMGSLRRSKHQTTEVQEMVTFKEVKEPKGFDTADLGHKALQKSAADAMGGAMTAALAKQISTVAAVALERQLSSSAGTKIDRGASPSPAASSVASLNTTSRLSSMSRRSELGASPLTRQLQQEENLMSSIGSRTATEQQQAANPNNASERFNGTPAAAPPVHSGGWEVQQSAHNSTKTSTAGAGLGSTPGSPLMQSLLKSTLNKTATMVRGQDITHSNPGASPLGSLRGSTTAKGDGGIDGGQRGSFGASAMAKQLAELGLPPSKW